MEFSKDNSKIIEELQLAEHNLQGIIGQKQMFQVEMQEVENALKELGETKDEVYKILSGIMIKTDKQELIKELEERKKIIDLRIGTMEKQEDIFKEKSEKLKEKLSGTLGRRAE
ncbi:MAG: prefoldin subunit [Nanoarchaeota archaeon]|nr:prefoldin subunit [Nanoarchaeota archaeon]